MLRKTHDNFGVVGAGTMGRESGCSGVREGVSPESVIKSIVYEVCTDMHVVVIEMECDKDHIHILLKYPPIYSVTQIVSRLKQITTYRLWKKYPYYLKKLYWKEHTLWSDGYFACSVGDASEEIIEAYIKNQG